MNCREALELLDESLEGVPAHGVGWRLKLHLWCCRNCRRYFASYQMTLDLERAAFRDAAEDFPTVPAELVAEILAELGKPHSSSPDR